MQYFSALKRGQVQVRKAREYLNSLTQGRAMPAMALRGQIQESWEPVGEENLYAIVNEASGYVLGDSGGCIVAIVDSTGTSKAIVQGVGKQEEESLIEKFVKDGLEKFEGRVILPV
ncbi:MAG: hypothetical protein R1F52_06410 [Candidatus Nitrosoabyssus spongiisocia]|nr:MAG: hypothetical protein R1F52_06410 [Nitrosopumilaceae archaeon AB1(1)]